MGAKITLILRHADGREESHDDLLERLAPVGERVNVNGRCWQVAQIILEGFGGVYEPGDPDVPGWMLVCDPCQDT